MATHSNILSWKIPGTRSLAGDTPWDHKESDTTEVTQHACIPLFPPNYAIYSEKAMAPHSSPLAWKIPWMEEPGRLQSMGLLTVGHD